MDRLAPRHRLLCLGLLMLLLMPLKAFAQRDNRTCGDLQNAYGPFDYTNPSHFKTKLPVVTSYHFTPQVENLISGQNGRLHEDIDYTLRAFPNHYRALNAMARFQRKDPAPAQKNEIYTTECYFERALRLKQDPTVHMLYAIHLQLTGKLTAARSHYEKALTFETNAPELHYNYGLLLTDLKEYELAQEHAKKAYAGGYPLPGLRDRLRAVNHWQAE